MSTAQDQIAILQAERDEYAKALKEIAFHPHCDYYDPSYQHETDRQYAIGAADGHRCAAKIARRAIGVHVED